MAQRGSRGKRNARSPTTASEKLVRLRSKGQVTVPARQLSLLGLRPGDQLIARVVGDHIVLAPGEVTVRAPRPKALARTTPTRVQLDERRRVLATIQPLSSEDIDAIEPIRLRGRALTDEELEEAISEGRE